MTSITRPFYDVNFHNCYRALVIVNKQKDKEMNCYSGDIFKDT